ncbi:hypothetical protein V1478_002192 [Vespula squamosa]|uniref:Uncharacterized protein n=1 Tax=Vespula squamosa TaxID=30214 RepID=A0ABD2BW83_VESSQ
MRIRNKRIKSSKIDNVSLENDNDIWGGEDGISLNGTPYETFQRRRRRGGRCFHYEGASVRYDTLVCLE